MSVSGEALSLMKHAGGRFYIRHLLPGEFNTKTKRRQSVRGRKVKIIIKQNALLVQFLNGSRRTQVVSGDTELRKRTQLFQKSTKINSNLRKTKENNKEK